jgi:hypothetical protein
MRRPTGGAATRLAERAQLALGRRGVGLYVLTLADDRIRAMTRFENTALPWFGLPRSLPAR